jgi:uncharacterized sulfatase
VFNSEKSHESRIRSRPHTAVHDPAGVRIPAYHPDTPEVRRDWAQYYDGVSAADADAGARLAELEAAGLADDTIVFYFADHGSGMPRNKRWPYDSGLHVPLVVYIPPKFRELRPVDEREQTRVDRLVSFVDFAPTVLSLAGVEPPAWLQGQAFLGRYAAPPREYVYGFRGRMDERYDLVRSVSDGRYVYERNFMPHKIYGQHLDYMFQTPTTRVWRQLHDEGKLSSAQDVFWNAKPSEELYDLATDRDEVHNLAASAEHAQTLARMRGELHSWMLQVRDVGLLPEGQIHARSRGTTPYDMGPDDAAYPLEKILAMAELASGLHQDAIDRLAAGLQDQDSAVRYWAALGYLMRGRAGVDAGQAALTAALGDSSPYVAIVAAEALAAHGAAAERQLAKQLLISRADWSRNEVFVAMAALNAIDALGPVADGWKAILSASQPRGNTPHPRYADYVPRLLKRPD